MQQFASYPSLRDRGVLITGGGSGIGASMVEQFALQGARVAFLDVAVAASQGLVESLRGKCEHAPIFVACDLTDIGALQKAIAQVASTLGSLGVLINNAGNDDRHEWSEVTPEYWDERLAVNLKHYFFAAQTVAPLMKANGGGSIVNMSSISWIIPTPKLSVYVVAKAGIVGMTRSMAHDFGDSNIRVNAVLPGAIFTERQRRLWMGPDYEAEILGKQCLKRRILPEEVSRFVLFLASDDSSAMTNQSYVIDGGWV